MSYVEYYSAPLIVFRELLSEIEGLVERTDSTRYPGVYRALGKVSKERQRAIRFLNNPVELGVDVFRSQHFSVAKFSALNDEYFGDVEKLITHVSELVGEALPLMDQHTVDRLDFNHLWFIERFEHVRSLHRSLTLVHSAMEFHLTTAMQENVITQTAKRWQYEAVEHQTGTYYAPLMNARDAYFSAATPKALACYIEVAQTLRANPHSMLTDPRYASAYVSRPERRAETDRALDELIATELMIELIHE